MDTSLAPFDLSGKVAVITGGGTGVGNATAHLLSERGAKVVVAGRRAEHLDETVNEVRNLDDCAALISTRSRSMEASTSW